MKKQLLGPVSRIIHFVKDVPAITQWYQDIFGLKPVGKITKEWAELDAGGCNLAFHHYRTNQVGAGREPHIKVCFASSDVAAAKELLESRGAKLGSVKVFGDLHLCDGTDPEGNRFQLSSRGT